MDKVSGLKKAFTPKLTHFIVIYLKNDNERDNDFLFNPVNETITDMVTNGVASPIIFNYLLVAIQGLSSHFNFKIMENKNKIEKVLSLIYDVSDKTLLHQLLSYNILCAKKVRDSNLQNLSFQ